jgi:glycosyltransferase involved in cell wall biosynthesis
VGRIDAEKNPHLLVDALDRLERAAPGAYRLTWVGGGRMEEGVRAAVHDRGLGGIVDFAGYVPYGPRLLDLYRSADLFVHVSLTEGVPQVLLEAMACGTPIVATAVGGVTRATEGGRAARLVPAGDLAALVAAIENAVSGPDETFARATAGLQIARMHALDVEAARVATFLAG